MTTTELWLVYLTEFALPGAIYCLAGVIISRLLRPLWRRLGIKI